MKTQGAIVNRLLYYCNENHISVNRLANLSAVPPSTLKNIISGVSQNPGVVTLKKLCDGLDITLGEFFSAQIFEQLEQEIE